MTTERYDDELLSSVLDGMADEATIAAVEADPAARARLQRLRTVAEMVATPPAAADPDRRAQSIAAALSVAPHAPEVSSLAAARQSRHDRRRIPTQWVAVAAAAILALVAIPVIGSLGDDEPVDIAADSAAESAGSQSLGGEFDTADDGFADAVDDSTDTAMAELDGAEESGVDTDDSDAGTAEAADAGADGDDSADFDTDDTATAAPSTTTTPAATGRAIQAVSNTAVLQSFVEAGIIAPQYVITDIEIVENVNEECLEPFAGIGSESFGLARLTPPDGPEGIVLLYFAGPDEITVLDGEDCSPVG